jgi:putative spermidine/putrescine transport system substrate-binding protein
MENIGTNSRRSMMHSLVAGGAALALAVAMSATAQAKDTLRLLVWQGYADDDVVADFEKKYDADVQVVYLTSDDEMWTKLKGSDGADYDLFSVATSGLDKFIDNGLVKPIDVSKIPNLSSQIAQFKDLTKVAGVTRDGKVYGIPFAYGSIGLIYDAKKISEAPTSWSVLWDPKYKGQVLLSDTSEVNVTMVAIALGFPNPFKLTPDQLAQVKQKLLDLRPNIASYYSSPEESIQVYEAGDVSLIFSPWGEQGLGMFKKAGHDNMAYAIPDEGAQGWIDAWAVTKGNKNEKLAYEWLDFVYQKQVSNLLSERYNLGNTITPSPTFTYGSRLKWSEPVEDFTARNDLWNAVKAAQ